MNLSQDTKYNKIIKSKEKRMKHILISVIFVFGLLTNLFANELTQENVKSFLLESDKLVLSKNVDKFAELLDEQVDIIVAVDFNGKKEKTKLSKSEYLAKTKEGFTSTQNYVYKILDRKINIKNELAYITEQVEEKYIYNNQKVVGMSKVNSEIKLINNEFKIIKIEVILNNIQMNKI
jgi:hypothetical protein